MKRHLRLAGGILCLVLTAYFMFPLTIGALHIGMLWPSVLLLILSAMLLRPHWFDGIRPYRRLCRALNICLYCGLSVITVLFILMGICAADRPAPQGKVTVIVLGCQVNGTTPSLMLQSRIDAAYDYLQQNPDAVCIASGGMDDDEIITEASCIRSQLIGRGIEPTRIYSEGQSGSTAENLAYSAALIHKEGLPTHVAIASDNFHQLRAAIFARNNGLTSQSLGCHSLWFMGPGYWAREIFAIPAALIRGY